jgi:hypothetical protein
VVPVATTMNMVIVTVIILMPMASIVTIMAIAFCSFQEKHTVERYKHTSSHVCQNCYPEVHQTHTSEDKDNNFCENGDGNIYVYFP